MCPIVGDDLLRDLGLALLLVVIEKARRRRQILRICDQGRMRIVSKLPQVFRITQQVEVALHQLRIPNRLKALLVYRQAFMHRAFSVLHHRVRPDRKYLVPRKLLAIVTNQLFRRRVFLFRNQKLQKARIERRFHGIAGNPRAVLCDRDFFRQPWS